LHSETSRAGENDLLPGPLRRRFSVTAMDHDAQTSNSAVEETPINEFASLALARAYIDSVRETIGSFGAHELIDVLEHLDRAYREFPELALDCPPGELLEGVRSAARDMPDRTSVPLLMYCVALDPSCWSSVTSLLEKIAGSDNWPSLPSVLGSLYRSRQLRWDAIKPIVDMLRRRGRADTALQVISEMLDCARFNKEESASDIGDILICLLSDTHSLGINRGALAEAARSARHRLYRPPFRRNVRQSAAALLAMAERLRAAPSPQRTNPDPDLAWPSGRMSFDEFLLQWPCEIELPFDLDDAVFVEEAYRAILLRGSEVAETDQYLRLLRDGTVSRTWIIEDLLASEELRSLERRLRVISGGHVITEPGGSGAEEMAAVTWPWSAS
jgi:hypothetical protein